MQRHVLMQLLADPRAPDRRLLQWTETRTLLPRNGTSFVTGAGKADTFLLSVRILRGPSSDLGNDLTNANAVEFLDYEDDEDEW